MSQFCFNVTMDFKLLYFTDPMCSWCYGFAPQMMAISQAVANEMPTEIVPGGLRPYTRTPMPPELSHEITHHWQQVAQTSGREFDMTFFDRNPGFVYDTEPASRAVNAVTAAWPARAMEFLDRVQFRFYSQGEDPTDESTYRGSAADVGIDPDEFSGEFRRPETEKQTRLNFQRAKLAGITAFPAVVLTNGERLKLVCVGYQTAEILIPVVRRQQERLLAAAAT